MSTFGILKVIEDSMAEHKHAWDILRVEGLMKDDAITKAIFYVNLHTSQDEPMASIDNRYYDQFDLIDSLTYKRQTHGFRYNQMKTPVGNIEYSGILIQRKEMIDIYINALLGDANTFRHITTINANVIKSQLEAFRELNGTVEDYADLVRERVHGTKYDSLIITLPIDKSSANTDLGNVLYIIPAVLIKLSGSTKLQSGIALESIEAFRYND